MTKLCKTHTHGKPKPKPKPKPLPLPMPRARFIRDTTPEYHAAKAKAKAKGEGETFPSLFVYVTEPWNQMNDAVKERKYFAPYEAERKKRLAENAATAGAEPNHKKVAKEKVAVKKRKCLAPHEEDKKKRLAENAATAGAAPNRKKVAQEKVAQEKVAQEKVDGPYDGQAKRAHRFEFGSNCKQALLDGRGNSQDLLYLEVSSGKTTQQLLDCGFKQSDLHPCNRSRTELDGLLEKYPGVVVEHGDMLEIFKEQYWLGAWFDLETPLLLLDVPGQPWDQERVPEFGRAAVCAVSLPNRRVGGFAEQFAVELQVLMQNGSRFLTSPQMARAYSGRSNKQNMVFGLAHYDLRRWEPEDYLQQQVHVPLNFYRKFNGVASYMLVNDHLVAVVTRASEAGMLHVKFQSCEGWFFHDEDPEPPLSPATVEAWIVQRSRALAGRV